MFVARVARNSYRDYRDIGLSAQQPAEDRPAFRRTGFRRRWRLVMVPAMSGRRDPKSPWRRLAVSLVLPALAGCVSQAGVAVGPEGSAIAEEPAPVGGLDRPSPVADTAPAVGPTAAATPTPVPLPHPDVSTPAPAPVAAPEPPPAAIAEIAVESQSLSGFWKVVGPKFVDFSTGIFSGVRVEYSPEMGERNICVVVDKDGELTGICSTGVAKPATGHRDGDHVVLRWWNGPVNLIFTGDLKDGRAVTGTLSGGVIGMKVTGGVPMSLERLTPGEAAAPASAGLVRDVLDDLRAGALTPGRYGAEAIAHLQPELAHRPIGIDAPSITYLGRIHIRWQKRQTEKVQDVYKVASGASQSICRIGVDDKGQVADFDCRALDI
jgi:hypothetical protein